MENKDLYMFIGTYTSEKSEGIYVYRFNSETGDSEYVGMSKVDNPSFLVSTGEYVYSVTENEENPSYANAFSFDRMSGELKLLKSVETNGAAPCYINSNKKNSHIVTANYKGGNITVFPVNDNGSLSEACQIVNFEGKGIDTERQEQPHIHCVLFPPDEKYLFVSDLGTDHIYRFEVDHSSGTNFLKQETLTKIKVAHGSGPRHLAFHPDGEYLYLINELSGTVMVFNYNNGDLTLAQTILADEFQASGSADIVITPDGKYLYASVRLENDGIAIFSVNPDNGQLTKTGYKHTGQHPRNLAITPNGKFLLSANRDSNCVEIFSIGTNGSLQNIGKNINISQPVCVVFS